MAGPKLSAEPLFLPRNHEFLWDGNGLFSLRNFCRYLRKYFSIKYRDTVELPTSRAGVSSTMSGFNSWIWAIGAAALDRANMAAVRNVLLSEVLLRERIYSHFTGLQVPKWSFCCQRKRRAVSANPAEGSLRASTIKTRRKRGSGDASRVQTTSSSLLPCIPRQLGSTRHCSCQQRHFRYDSHSQSR